MAHAFGRRIVNWSSYIVLTEPIPDRLAELGWTGGEGLADARFTLHYLRTTRDGRIAIGGGGGRAGFGGRIGPVFTDDATATSRAAAGLRRLFPSLRGRPHRGRVGRPDRHLRRPSPDHRDRAGRPIHFAHGYSGQRRRAVGRGRTGAGRAGPRHEPVGLAPAAVEALVGGRARGRSRRSRSGTWARASSARPSSAARRSRSAAGRRTRCSRELTRLPRRLGYHLSPD